MLDVSGLAGGLLVILKGLLSHGTSQSPGLPDAVYSSLACEVQRLFGTLCDLVFTFVLLNLTVRMVEGVARSCDVFPKTSFIILRDVLCYNGNH